MEFGQQRQRVNLKKFVFNRKELVELFSRTFHTELNFEKYDIWLFEKRVDAMAILDFSQLGNYARFRIQSKNQQYSSADEIVNKLSRRRKNIFSFAFLEFIETTIESSIDGNHGYDLYVLFIRCIQTSSLSFQCSSIRFKLIVNI